MVSDLVMRRRRQDASARRLRALDGLAPDTDDLLLLLSKHREKGLVAAALDPFALNALISIGHAQRRTGYDDVMRAFVTTNGLSCLRRRGVIHA